MKYKKNILLEIVAGSFALIGGGCIIGDLAAEGLGIAAGRHGDPLTRDILNGASRVVGKRAQRSDNTRVKYEDANVDIYRSREESKIRIEEERALDKIYNQSGQGLDEEEQETIRGRISAIQRKYRKYPFDWERNVGMIARAYKSEELTSSDKGKLQDILETMYSCTHGNLRRLSLEYGVPVSRLWKTNDAIQKLNLNFKRNKRRILGDTDGIISLYEFMIKHQDTNPRLRCKVASSYSGLIKIKSSRLSNKVAVNLIRAKIDLLERIKDHIPLSKRELSSIYLSGSSRSMERLLRSKLAKTDPEFKEKEQTLKNTVNDLKKLVKTSKTDVTLTPEIIELAREIGYLSWLRHQTRWLDQVMQ